MLAIHASIRSALEVCCWRAEFDICSISRRFTVRHIRFISASPVFMAPATRVSNRDKHPGYIVRPGPYSARKTAVNRAAIAQEMDEDHAWEGGGEGEEPTRLPASSSAKVMHTSGTHACNQLIDAKRGQKSAAAENGKPHEYKHSIKKEQKQYYLDFDSEDENEVEGDSGPYGKRQRSSGPVVYNFDADNKRPTSKKLKRDGHISQPVRGLHVEVVLPKWREIVARDQMYLKQTSNTSHCESHSEDKKDFELAQASNVDYGGFDDDEAIEEDEESNLTGQNASQRAPSEVSQCVPTNNLRRTSVSPPQNSQSEECHSDPGDNTSGAQRSTPLVSTQRQDMDTLPQVFTFQAYVPASSAQQPAKKLHPRFLVEDLPGGSQQRFREEMCPMWLDFVSTLENPWDLTSHIDVMQEIWNRTFTDINHTVQKANDPVYFLLLQRTSNYRCDVAKRGEIAVAAYLESIGLKTPDEIAQHINFLVPSVSHMRGDENSVKCYPFMWREAKNIMNVDGHIERTETKGAFCSRPISDTLAHFLEIRECIPQALRQTDHPRGALALATVSVERALRMYSTGIYVKPEDRRQSSLRFSRKHWGVTTEEVMISVKKTTSRGWKKIIKAAIPYIRTRKPHHNSLRATLEKDREAPNGYTHCVDVDSCSDSGSDIIF